MPGLRTVQTPSSSFQCPVGFLASQRPHHSRLIYHVLHSRTDFACFSLKNNNRTSEKTLTLTLLNQQHSLPMMVFFQPVTEEEIRKLIVESPTKTCMLDPIPTPLTKECLSDPLPLITRIVNSSLCSGVVPPQFKQAVVIPMLKKPGLDPNDLKNFRPVSNLPFISKILEKVVLTQLQKHLSENDLLEIRQSAYRKNHSTETALLSVVDGLLRNADDRLVCVLFRGP